MTSIWFPNNKYPPNTKNYLPCFVLGGGFSIRRKGLNDPNKCHHSQPLPGNNKYIYIYIYTPWWEQVVVPLLYWIRHWRCQPLPAMTSSCHVSPVFYGWWMSGAISSNTIIWYIYIYYIYTYIHILSPLLLCTIINIIIYYYYYHYCCYNIIICIGDCHIHFESQ